MYHYFVSYQFNDKEGETGLGQINLIVDREIIDAEGCVAMNNAILETSPQYEGIVILFFHLLRVDGEE